MESTTIEAINRFSARWAGLTPSSGSTVFSAACAWPLLGLLAAAASGSVRDELQEALGVPATAAQSGAVDLLTGLPGLPGVGAALGLWARADLPLRREWTESLPPGALDRLAGDGQDKKRLDAWASEHTHGLIPSLPVTVTPSTVLVLATALALRTRWARRFTDAPLTVRSGPWASLGTIAGLERASATLDDVTVSGLYTRLRLEGDNGIDVHLVLGPPGLPAAEILAAGLVPGVGGSSLPLGAKASGLTVEETLGRDPRPELAVQAVRFTLRAEHDLISSPRFGLQSAAQAGDHFPGISPDPLRVSEAKQGAMAILSAEGFEAAAVTSVAMTRAAYATAETPRKTVRVVFDRPFGFHAVHRETGLILATGWVSEPEKA